jgi:hypothetical protein
MDTESILMIDECIEMNTLFVHLEQQLLKTIIARLNNMQDKASFTIDECTKLFNISNQQLVYVLNQPIENNEIHVNERMLQLYGISALTMVSLLLRNNTTKHILHKVFENGYWL